MTDIGGEEMARLVPATPPVENLAAVAIETETAIAPSLAHDTDTDTIITTADLLSAATAAAPSSDNGTQSLTNDATTTQSSMTDADELTCRICRLSAEDEPLTSPCKCSGSIEFVHESCLLEWLTKKNSHNCELCGYQFKLETKFSDDAPLAPSIVDALIVNIGAALRYVPKLAKNFVAVIVWLFMFPLLLHYAYRVTCSLVLTLKLPPIGPSSSLYLLQRHRYQTVLSWTGLTTLWLEAQWGLLIAFGLVILLVALVFLLWQITAVIDRHQRDEEAHQQRQQHAQQQQPANPAPPAQQQPVADIEDAGARQYERDPLVELIAGPNPFFNNNNHNANVNNANVDAPLIEPLLVDDINGEPVLILEWLGFNDAPFYTSFAIATTALVFSVLGIFLGLMLTVGFGRLTLLLSYIVAYPIKLALVNVVDSFSLAVSVPVSLEEVWHAVTHPLSPCTRYVDALTLTAIGWLGSTAAVVAVQRLSLRPSTVTYCLAYYLIVWKVIILSVFKLLLYPALLGFMVLSAALTALTIKHPYDVMLTVAASSVNEPFASLMLMFLTGVGSAMLMSKFINALKSTFRAAVIKRSIGLFVRYAAIDDLNQWHLIGEMVSRPVYSHCAGAMRNFSFYVVLIFLCVSVPVRMLHQFTDSMPMRLASFVNRSDSVNGGGTGGDVNERNATVSVNMTNIANTFNTVHTGTPLLTLPLDFLFFQFVLPVVFGRLDFTKLVRGLFRWVITAVCTMFGLRGYMLQNPHGNGGGDESETLDYRQISHFYLRVFGLLLTFYVSHLLVVLLTFYLPLTIGRYLCQHLSSPFNILSNDGWAWLIGLNLMIGTLVAVYHGVGFIGRRELKPLLAFVWRWSVIVSKLLIAAVPIFVILPILIGALMELVVNAPFSPLMKPQIVSKPYWVWASGTLVMKVVIRLAQLDVHTVGDERFHRAVAKITRDGFTGFSLQQLLLECVWPAIKQIVYHILVPLMLYGLFVYRDRWVANAPQWDYAAAQWLQSLAAREVKFTVLTATNATAVADTVSASLTQSLALAFGPLTEDADRASLSALTPTELVDRAFFRWIFLTCLLVRFADRVLSFVWRWLKACQRSSFEKRYAVGRRIVNPNRPERRTHAQAQVEAAGDPPIVVAEAEPAALGG